MAYYFLFLFCPSHNSTYPERVYCDDYEFTNAYLYVCFDPLLSTSYFPWDFGGFIALLERELEEIRPTSQGAELQSVSPERLQHVDNMWQLQIIYIAVNSMEEIYSK